MCCTAYEARLRLDWVLNFGQGLSRGRRTISLAGSKRENLDDRAKTCKHDGWDHQHPGRLGVQQYDMGWPPPHPQATSSNPKLVQFSAYKPILERSAYFPVFHIKQQGCCPHWVSYWLPPSPPFPTS